MTSLTDQLSSQEAMLVSAIRAHRTIVETSPDDSQAVMGAINQLHEAILEYADRVMEISGWGNPFAGPYTDEESADDREDDVSAGEVDDV